MQARDTAYFESNGMPQTFSLAPVFRPVLSKGARKANIVWHLLKFAIKFSDEYFCFGINFSQNFFSTFFSELFFLKFFFCGLYSRCLPVYRDKTDSMYLCDEKYDRQAVEIEL